MYNHNCENNMTTCIHSYDFSGQECLLSLPIILAFFHKHRRSYVRSLGLALCLHFLSPSSHPGALGFRVLGELFPVVSALQRVCNGTFDSTSDLPSF